MFSEVHGFGGCKNVLPLQLFHGAICRYSVGIGQVQGRDVQKLTPWNCFLPQKLTGSKEVEKIPEL
jgi:hypothetical protein